MYLFLFGENRQLFNIGETGDDINTCVLRACNSVVLLPLFDDSKLQSFKLSLLGYRFCELSYQNICKKKRLEVCTRYVIKDEEA